MDILSRPVLQADHRIAYDSDPSQFGDLWLPETRGLHRVPVVVFFHGGWWKSAYDLGYAGYLCRALKEQGIATWSVEYRRVGVTGGGWPTTFQDAAAGFEHVAALARIYPLDLSRIVTMGHSAGGHLAFWVAGRQHVPAHSEVAGRTSGIDLRAAIALAGAVDLRLTIDLAGSSTYAHDREEVYGLMGGSPQDLPSRYEAGNPGDLLPLQAPQVLIQGTVDDQIPPQLPHAWKRKADGLGSHADVLIVAGADHFDVIDPESSAWPMVLAQVKKALHV